MRQIHGNNYVGPVPEVLEMDSQRQKRVLDVSTGTGIWYLRQELYLAERHTDCFRVFIQGS